ncbi:hypothetical protein WJX84_009041 [Apatococcus fuscideae]|uniref:Uncharacterized protein n=1 Tax=Apatococcus fuscideae TaxID=2026836 RepID=A0AAW1T3N4_9CHLO
MQSVWEEQLSAVRAHLLVVRGGSCPRLSLEEARRMTIVASTAASTQIAEHPRALLVAEGDRRPETLGIRPLPEYNSLEEAMKALGSRSIPTRQAVEEELAKVSDPKGDPSWFDDYLAEHQTALAKDPADYFAFIG